MNPNVLTASLTGRIWFFVTSEPLLTDAAVRLISSRSHPFLEDPRTLRVGYEPLPPSPGGHSRAKRCLSLKLGGAAAGDEAQMEVRDSRIDRPWLGSLPRETPAPISPAESQAPGLRPRILPGCKAEAVPERLDRAAGLVIE
jgi:hypothetical protein